MEQYLFMKKALEIVSKGSFFRKAYGIILRALAVLTGIAGIVGWVTGWRNMFMITGDNPVGVILGGVLVQLLMVVFLYMVIHGLWIRAKNIEELPETGYFIIPIVSMTLKIFGEMYACVLLFTGLAGGLFQWFAGFDLTQMLEFSLTTLPTLGATGFLAGLITILAGVAFAFAALVFFYFLSELMIVIVDIAISLKAKNGEGKK